VLKRALEGCRATEFVGAADDNLLGRAVGGECEALVALLKRHGAAARQAVVGRIPQRWQSLLSEDDVIQQTYADAVAYIDQFDAREEAAFAAWLATIARRNLSDAVKMLEREKRGGDRRRIEPRGRDESVLALCDVLVGTGGTPSRHAAREEARKALQCAIDELPEAYARVVAMYDLEQRSVQEVAEALDRSPGAVFMLRARAHERLHEIMGATSKYFGRS
jgi:RNA polymerase sigma-70 factor (subfamily 1)